MEGNEAGNRQGEENMTKQTKIKDRKAYMKAYNQRPEVKAYKKAYYQRPEVKAYKKAYNQRPEVKAYKKDNFLIIPNCKGNSTRMFTNGVTKKMKKMIPEMMNEVALKLLKEKKT